MVENTQVSTIIRQGKGTVATLFKDGEKLNTLGAVRDQQAKEIWNAEADNEREHKKRDTITQIKALLAPSKKILSPVETSLIQTTHKDVLSVQKKVDLTSSLASEQIIQNNTITDEHIDTKKPKKSRNPFQRLREYNQKKEEQKISQEASRLEEEYEKKHNTSLESRLSNRQETEEQALAQGWLFEQAVEKNSFQKRKISHEAHVFLVDKYIPKTTSLYEHKRLGMIASGSVAYTSSYDGINPEFMIFDNNSMINIFVEFGEEYRRLMKSNYHKSLYGLSRKQSAIVQAREDLLIKKLGYGTRDEEIYKRERIEVSKRYNYIVPQKAFYTDAKNKGVCGDKALFAHQLDTFGGTMSQLLSGTRRDLSNPETTENGHYFKIIYERDPILSEVVNYYLDDPTHPRIVLHGTAKEYIPQLWPILEEQKASFFNGDGVVVGTPKFQSAYRPDPTLTWPDEIYGPIKEKMLMIFQNINGK